MYHVPIPVLVCKQDFQDVRFQYTPTSCTAISQSLAKLGLGYNESVM